MKVQIAGVRTVADAKMCAECGVDIIGLLVGQRHEAFEFISKELAREIKVALPRGTETTLITHIEEAGEIIEIAKYIGVDYIQLHSYIDESEVEKIHKTLPKVKLIRLIHISSDGKILNDISNIKFVDYYFTDSINFKTNQVGGTGLTHDFTVDKYLVETLNKPVFIAGGLTPDNVSEIIKLVHPYGVDVNSGCRGADGYRDRNKVIAFVKNAKSTL